MKKALIVIDYSNDFIHEDGALSCGVAGRDIETAITKLVTTFTKNGDLVVQAVDGHKKNDSYHPETSLFPPHNIYNTWGRELYGEVGRTFQEGVHVYLDKTRYSAFAGTPLELLLRERGIEELHLVGVCTDICIMHTAVDAYNKGFRIAIHEDAVASFDENTHHVALNHFKTCLGSEVVRGKKEGSQ
ncbi:cysteine hydrolase (plasmid) [Pontibacillus sp. ALD_SL1]|uniref:cysteine hydrolase family protein n=1 Tax=Pontibacillus sp. ALD_SL1 TaxID=2777185 RepID=UPI001A96651F|nr:isochorismatase family cysteine hydrolase [Pontibacillus sp. ALD_SL1]QST02642.1 cysteine hydrolase [Pontibacillus sp. ALD_SL1]